MSRTGSRGLGIEIGPLELKIVAIEREPDGTCRLEGATTLPLPQEGFTEAVAVSLRSRLKAEGWAGRPSVLGISGRDLMMRYLHVPRVEAWRLARMMEIETEETSRTSEEKTCYDYRILNVPSRKVDQYSLVIAMARDTWIDQIYSVSRRAGLKVQAVTPTGIGLYNSFVKFGDIRDKETVVIVHLGTAGMECVVVSGGILYFVRNLSVGIDTLAEFVLEQTGEDLGSARDRILREADLLSEESAPAWQSALLAGASQLAAGVESTVKFCRTQLALVDLRVDRYVLSGEGAGIRGLREFLMKSLGNPVLGFDVRPQISLEVASDEAKSILSSSGSGFQAVLGLAQMAADRTSFSIELISGTESGRREFVRRRLPSYASIAVTVLFLVAALFLAWSQEDQARGATVRLVEERNKYQKLAVTLEEAEQQIVASGMKVDLLASSVRPGTRYFQLLGLLQKQTPEHVFLEAVGLGANSVGGSATRGSSPQKSLDGEGSEIFAVKGFVEESVSDVRVILADYAALLGEHERIARCEIDQQVLDRDRGILNFRLRVVFRN